MTIVTLTEEQRRRLLEIVGLAFFLSVAQSGDMALAEKLRAPVPQDPCRAPHLPHAVILATAKDTGLSDVFHRTGAGQWIGRGRAYSESELTDIEVLFEGVDLRALDEA